MGLAARHKLLLSSPETLSTARKNRLRLASLRAKLRTAQDAEEPVASSAAPVHISPEMRESLLGLGYEESDIEKMTPDVASDLISEGVTKEEQQQAAARREELFDAIEDKVLSDLEAVKKKLDLARERLKKASEQVEKLDASLAEVEARREAENDPDVQERLRKKSEWIVAHIDRATSAEESIRREIQALESIASGITKTEEGLINQLQEASDAAVLTPGTKDDEIVEQLMSDKLKELDAISSLRERLFSVQKDYDKKLEQLFRLHKRIADLVDTGKRQHLSEINTLREAVETLQAEVDADEKEQKRIVKEILRHEDSLRDSQTESKLQELEDALKDIPEDLDSIAKIKQESKKDIQEEDVGKDIAAKPHKYKRMADDMLKFVDSTSQKYGDFVISFLAPDIPNDPAVDAFVRKANAAILKRAREAKKLADRFSRNPMHRSAILLVPSLYEFLASTMEGVVNPEVKEAALRKQAEAVYDDLIENGLIKEAISFRDIVDTARSVGQGVGQAAKWTKDKANKFRNSVDSLIDQAKESLDRIDFQAKDSGPRRDPKAKLKQQQKALSELLRLEQQLKASLAHAYKLRDKFSAENDVEGVRAAGNAIVQLSRQIKDIGERKDVLGKGLAHAPESGIMAPLEQAAQRPKTDYEQAVRLLDASMPELISFLKEGLPNNLEVERELLRQSAQISQIASKMIKESYKAQKKYPSLPLTIQAYGKMFLAIDDALTKALRAVEAV